MIKRSKILSIVAALSVVICCFIVWKNQQPKHHLSYAVFHNKTGGWGYNIIVDTSIFIHQEVVPVLQTQKGFDNPQQASRTALLVVNKIMKGKIPTVNKSELQSILLTKDADKNE